MALPSAIAVAPPSPFAQLSHRVQGVFGADSIVWSKLVDTGGSLAVNLSVAALILVVTIWAANWASRLTRQAFAGLNRHRRADPTLPIFAASLARNTIIVVGLIAVLQRLGVQTTSIIAVLGAASLAIGLALQGALSNVAAGVMILLFRPYRVGDIIESGGRIGRVRALDLFLTELTTLDNLKIVLPNSKVFGDIIVNHSVSQRRRADVVFRTPLTTDVPALIDGLRAKLADDARVLPEPAPLIEVTGLAEAFTEIAVRPWGSPDDYGSLKADVLLWANVIVAGQAKADKPAPKSASAPAVLSPVRTPAPAQGRR